MPEDKVQAQDIRKLLDEWTRLDERLKIIQDKQRETDEHFHSLQDENLETSKKIAVLDSMVSNCTNGCPRKIDEKLDELEKTVVSIDKRFAAFETDSGKRQDRWNRLLTFIIQLAWVVLAAWLLTKLNLQPPNIP